jgi:hypothetical protein
MTYEQLQKTPQKNVENLIRSLREVADMLEESGAKVLPHLCDSDQNAGQRLRDAMRDCHIGEVGHA